jgi:hypothetical protein
LAAWGTEEDIWWPGLSSVVGPSSSFRSLLVGAVGAWLLRESQRDAIFVFMGGFDHFDVSLNSAIAWQMPN